MKNISKKKTAQRKPYFSASKSQPRKMQSFLIQTLPYRRVYYTATCLDLGNKQADDVYLWHASPGKSSACTQIPAAIDARCKF